MIEELKKSAAVLKEHLGDFIPDVAIIMGSGMSEALKDFKVVKEIEFSSIPGFTPPKVMGHKGVISLCTVGTKKVACLRGRKHLYEGCKPAEIVLPLRCLGLLGLKNIFITNAAGSLNPAYHPGEFMIINNHINFQGTNPVIGPNEEALGSRFFDMTQPYDSKWGELATGLAQEQNLKVHQGVYTGVLGPNFETATEIKMFHLWGGDAVGMSTVSEVVAARHMGIRVFGISMITNYGAGIQPGEVAHDDVLDLAHEAGPKLMNLLMSMIEKGDAA